jgi:predicted HAD superfamily Cof-like phosphohydrolase
MKKQLAQVRQFHDTFQAHVAETPTTEIPTDVKQSRIALIKEETDELIEAIEQDDLNSIAKELADVLYVVFGTVLSFGLREKMEQTFTDVHHSNMSKLNADGSFKLSADGKKVLKGDGYREVKIEF